MKNSNLKLKLDDLLAARAAMAELSVWKGKDEPQAKAARTKFVRLYNSFVKLLP